MPLVLPKQTDGLLLREFIAEDVEALADIEFDPQVKQYVGGAINVDRAQWIDKIRHDLPPPCAAVALPELEFAGSAQLSRYARGVAELRIVIGRGYFGRQLGRKAASLLIPAAFEELKASAIVGVADPRNEASIKLLEAFGFRRCGRKDYLHEPEWQRGHLIFELTEASYHARSAKS